MASALFIGAELELESEPEDCRIIPSMVSELELEPSPRECPALPPSPSHAPHSSSPSSSTMAAAMMARVRERVSCAKRGGQKV